MGSTNLDADSEVRRRLHARDNLTRVLPSARTGRNRREIGVNSTTNVTTRATFALSGQTTTSRGHVIVPPTKARVIALELESVPGCQATNDNTNDFSVSDESGNLHKPPYRSGLVAAFCKNSDEPQLNGISNDDTEDINNNEDGRTFSCGMSQETVISDDAKVGRGKKEGVQGENDNIRNVIQRGFSPTKEESNDPRVQKIPQFMSRIKSNASPREQYAMKKRDRGDMTDPNKQSDSEVQQRGRLNSNDSGKSATRPGRRRRQNNIQTSTETVEFHKASYGTSDKPSRRKFEPTRKSAVTSPTFGPNSTNIRKHSPYLPTYIQPMLEESTYRTQRTNNRRRDDRSSVVQPRRKLSVNRFDSSTSSSSSLSSSSDSENESPNRQPAKKLVTDNLMIVHNMQPETPETSDAERRRPDGRRRRTRRQRPAVDAAAHASSAASQKTGIIASESNRIRDGYRRRNRQESNAIPMLDDKYVTLPDNYTHSEFVTKNEHANSTTSAPYSQSYRNEAAAHNSNESSSSQRIQNHAKGFTTVGTGGASGRNEAISHSTTSSYAEKHKIPARLNAEKLIISGGQEAFHFGEKRDRSVGQVSSPADKSHNEDRLTPESRISKHVDLSGNSPDLNKARQISARFTGEKLPDQRSTTPVGSRRNSNSNSESKAVGDIRSIFENRAAPIGDLGQSYLKKGPKSHGSNARRVTATIAQDSSDNGAVQSQPMLSARKIGEDFWPRDEATERLLSRKSSFSSNTLPTTKNDYDTISLTMQETIDQLHKFADDKTLVSKSKSRVNSTGDLSRNSGSERTSTPTQSEVRGSSSEDIQKQSHCPRRGSNNRSGLVNLTKVQKIKISPLDLSPCMSSTETLKDLSSGEYQGRNSRSHSIDSTASNPELANVLKDRNVHISSEVVYEEIANQDKSDLFIVEGPESTATEDDSHHNLNKNIEFLKSKHHSSSAGDLRSGKSNPKTMVMQMKELTASLRRFKLAGPPQPLINPSTNWQKATSKTDPILSVSPRGNVTLHSPNLETLSEHPEPPSPDMKTKTFDESSKSIYPSSKTTIMHESLDIDEGIVTEEEVTEDPLSYLKLDERLQELNKRRKRAPPSSQKDSDGSSGSNGSESTRSRSDPMSDRKRSTGGEKSIDSNLLGSLQSKKGVILQQIGSFDRESSSSHSVFSEHRSLYGDSALPDDENPEVVIVEEQESKSQVKPNKKKSHSDPNPKGVITHGFHVDAEAIQENEFLGVHSASSEPNVTEQTDKLGDLDQFKIYQTSKVLSENVLRTQDRNSNKATTQMVEEMEKSMFPQDADFMSPRVVRRNVVSMKARKRAENEALNNEKSGGKSIIGKLLASNTQQYQYPELEDSSPQSFISTTPGASTDSSPVRKQTQDILETEELNFKSVYDSMTGYKDDDILDDLVGDPNVIPLHSRSSSEPVDFGNSVNMENFQPAPGSYNRGRRPGIIQVPSLDNVGHNYPKTETTRSVSETRVSQRFNPPLHTQSMDTVFPTQKKKTVVHDMRLHVVKNLLETEESYVGSLQILFEDYMQPLKHPENHSTCEPRLVDEMFHKIPQLLQHHEKFYENVQECYQSWNHRDVKLGDLFLNSFNKDALLETYTCYIKNYLNAREAVRTAMQAKTAFKLFIEQCQRENKDKQGLADLMIKPVQRIPRYELIIKDLLKHTPEGHQDRDGLLIAQREIHTLAEQMNLSEKEAEAADKDARLLQDIEQIIEGCIDLCQPKRRFWRQDIIVEVKGGNKKDRSLWLFNDLMICTTAKKGGRGTLRRSSMNLWSLGQDRLAIDFANKYKFLWKFPLEDIEHLKGNNGPARQTVEKQLQVLQGDCEILNNIHKLSIELSCAHVNFDESLKELINSVNRQIAEKRQLSTYSYCPPGRVELGITTGDGVKTFLFEFPTEDNKVQFERLFVNAKRSLTTQKNRWEPTFMKAIPISKTRAGMQFSCAAPNVDLTPEVREVWVCNTDGYVGQVCFLSLESEPTQTQCITVCHAKICCIAQVPTWDRRLVPANTLLQEISKGPLGQPNRRHSSSASNPALAIMSWDDQDESDEDNTSPLSTMSSYSSYSVSPYSTNNSTNNYDALSTTDLSSLSTTHRLREGASGKKENSSPVLQGSPEDLHGEGVVSGVAQGILAGKDSMWLGTEDGKIHIYPSSESIRGTKHCLKIPHSAAVHCILYHEGQVFVALSNGDLVIYFRNVTTGEWDFENQKTKSRVSSPHAITKMVVVGQKEIWCGCQNQIKIIDIADHTETDHFNVTQDSKRQIHCMVCCGYGMWIALDKRPQIKLFHTVTHDVLADIDVSSQVSKMLASADAIIRQHKAACLRITALLVCKDLLWVGTSAGVVLTLCLPKITAHTSALPLPVMPPQGLAYGHTGHARFLTSVEVPDKDQSLSRGNSRRASSGGNKRRSSSTSGGANQLRTNTLVISGGDGYEDFRMNSNSESAGREDSTNHLLVWRA